MTKQTELPHLQAAMYALIIKEKLAPHCLQIEIAGSLRRKRKTVHDIDIVLIPKPDCMDKIKNECLAMHPFMNSDVPAPKWGEKIATFSYTGRVQVDLYFADYHSWPILLLIRTGSKEHNIRMTGEAKAQGKYLAADGSGLFNDRLKEQRIPVDCEEDIFEALRLPYVEPEFREVN